MMMKSNAMRFGKEAEDELSRRKSSAVRRLNEHRLIIKRNYPEIDSLRRQINDIALDFGAKIMASPDDEEALSSLAEQLLSAKRDELNALLIENGFDPDYLEKKCFCSVCHDTGVVDGEICSCLKQVLIEKTFNGSGLNSEQSFSSFRHDLFDDPKQRRALDKIFAYCLEYADSFPENELPDMLLMGAPGIGKTFLLNCIGGRILERGYSVLRITANKLVNTVLDSIRNPEVEMPDFTLPELLIIDDLGTEPMINNVTIETLLSIICERQDKKRSTLIATNKDTALLAKDYGDRIVSRLISPHSVKVIKITTPSIRMMKF